MEDTSNSENVEGRISAYQVGIGKAWNKSLKGIFEVGDLLNKAAKEFGTRSEEFARLRGSLPFIVRTAQYLAAIAADIKLRDPSVEHLLPPSWSTLIELQRFTPELFRTAIARDLINPEMERKDAIRILRELEYESSGSPPMQRNTGAVSSTTPVSPAKVNSSGYDVALTFLVPKALENRKALLDLNFVYWLASELFKNADGEHKIKVELDSGIKLSEKENSSYRVLTRLIAFAARLDECKRVDTDPSCAPMTSIQRLLSVFGADPEQLGENGFCFIERLALAYAQRQGIDFLQEQNFKWFASNATTEPVLLGSFLADVKVCELPHVLISVLPWKSRLNWFRWL